MPIKNIKSTNHLLSILKEKETMPILMYHTHRVYKCIATKIGKVALFFWGGGNQNSLEILKKINIKLSNENREFLLNLLVRYGAFTILDNTSLIQYAFGCKTMIACPQDIETCVTKCIQENKKLLESIFNRYTSRDNPSVYLSYAFTNGNATYMSWMLKQVFKYGISWYVLQRISNFIERYPQLISKLSKGNIIPYDGQYGMIQLTQEIHQLSCQKRVDVVLNQFNTSQKKLLKALPKDSKIISSFSKFDQLSKAKQRNFIRKVSTIEDVNEILNQLSFVVSNHFNWDKKSILDYLNNVEGLNYEIVVEKENLLLLDVKDYDTIKRIGKTTNWCISKNKTYWRNYMNERDRKQYVLIDLGQKEDSENSIIGFTVQKNHGIVAAHSFTNKNMLQNDSSNKYDNTKYTSIFKIVPPLDIYKILEHHSIEQSIFISSSPKYDWEQDYLIDIIDELTAGDFCVTKVINSGELLIRVEGENWKEILDDYTTRSSWRQYLVYLNFNLSQDNPNRILYAPLDRRISTDEEFVPYNTMYNSYGNATNINFERFIKDKNIEFDIICRTNTLENKLTAICGSNDIDEFIQFVHEHHENIPQIMLSCGITEATHNFFNRSILSYFSVDVVNVLKKYNLRISDLMGAHYLANELYSNILGRIAFHLSRERKNDLLSPYSNDEINALIAQPIELNIQNINDRPIKEVGKYFWWVLETLLLCEDSKVINSLVKAISEYDIYHPLIFKILSWSLRLLKDNELEESSLFNLAKKMSKTCSDITKFQSILLDLSRFNSWDNECILYVEMAISPRSPLNEIVKKIKEKKQVRV